MTRKTIRIAIRKEELEKIRSYVNEEPKTEEDCLGEDETISYTANFGDGYQMDVKCCGVHYREGMSNTAWAEAVFFHNEAEVACTEPCDEVNGEWMIEHDGMVYSAIVEEETGETK